MLVELTCMKRSLILLSGPIDSTLPAIQAMARILGPARLVRLDQAPGLEPFQRVLICATSDERSAVLNFIFDHLTDFSTRPTGLIHWSEENDPGWLPEAAGLVGCQSKQMAIIPPSAPLNAFIDFAAGLRSRVSLAAMEIDDDDLKVYVEDFLASHTTCALATVYQGQVRSTPLEYRYAAGHIYLLSEGGEKFAGVLNNGNAAIAIFEPFHGFERLAGMQCRGRARSPALNSEAYRRALEKWGLSPEKVAALPDPLYAIDVALEEAVFLWSGFNEKGLDTRQVYRF
jgi:hypothetical protein